MTNEAFDEEVSHGNLGEVHGRWGRGHFHGGCNFCSSSNKTYLENVFVVSGQGTQVRFCKNCFNKIREDFEA